MIRQSVLLTIIAVAALPPCPASADYAIPMVTHIEAKSGVPVILGAFFDCEYHFPYQGTAFVQHGTVMYKDITINECGYPKEPARVIIYVSDPGYKGPDEVNFPLGSGTAFVAHLTVR